MAAATSIPQSIWSPASGQGETSQVAFNNLVDNTGNLLADSTANNLIDASSTPSSVPRTTWATNDAG